MKRVAILLAGEAYNERYWHHRYRHHLSIDWSRSYENYKKYLYGYYESLGYQIDTYICSNPLPISQYKKIVTAYQPVDIDHLFQGSIIVGNNYCSTYNTRVDKIMKVIDMCINSSVQYEQIIITRFDLEFRVPFDNDEININPECFNISSILAPLPRISYNLLDDNIYIFPSKYMIPFQELLHQIPQNVQGIQKITRSLHHIEPQLEKLAPINGMLNCGSRSTQLRQFRFVRFSDTGTPVNPYI